MYRKFGKRLFDIVCSLCGLVVLSPMLLILALIMKINLGSPVIFNQERPGHKGKIFKLFKFRSMTNKKDENGNLLSDNERLTFLGKILRTTSMDELPELWNILKGDMSMVGPRPLLVQYLTLYSTEQMHRHDVKPGLTGYAQVNGRNSITWDEKFKLDCWYVDNLSFWLDIKIIFTTFVKVFKRKGINSGASSTMEFFTGNNEG